ncbi:hypothetical protein DSO57_1008406 [Entomophthora muscae]|uniref:Uncharacterized protein n=1 Tax=Entomophthora muscae TaxID=34485 RepID=A0ACC2TUY3_9FUNG|nr:hypothetical protein DSO57_1008406 [Entomophthora muscae]
MSIFEFDSLFQGRAAPTQLEFSNYLHKVEHSGENLEFLIWFQGYATRYLRPTKLYIPTVPIQLLQLLKRHPPATFDYSFTDPLNFECPRHLPFHMEITHVVKIFLDPCSPYELNIPGHVREKLLASLATDTRPDLFLPIYHMALDMLHSSIPRFLSMPASL